MFTVALFTLAKGWKQSKCLSPDDWINKMWYIRTVEYPSATKSDEVLTHATTQVNLKALFWVKEASHKKAVYYMKCPKQANLQQISCSQDLERGVWEWLPKKVQGFLLGWWKLELESGEVAQLCTCTEYFWIIHFKIIKVVNFMLCQFYNKKYIQKSAFKDLVHTYKLKSFSPTSLLSFLKFWICLIVTNNF